MLHYDKAYFDWQRDIGAFGGWAEHSKFAPYISPSDVVVDFGCGGGFVLSGIQCAKRIGIEINDEAAAAARTRLDTVYGAAAEVPSEIADVVISNHALEHVHHPLAELKELHRITKPGGKLVIVVPCESAASRYEPDDINQHLYSWSPMCLGNLLTVAAFSVQSSKAYPYMWPPRATWPLLRSAGRPAFKAASRARAWLDGRVSQSIAVAVKAP